MKNMVPEPVLNVGIVHPHPGGVEIHVTCFILGEILNSFYFTLGVNTTAHKGARNLRMSILSIKNVRNWTVLFKTKKL